jgi:hypothetical protein
MGHLRATAAIACGLCLPFSSAIWAASIYQCVDASGRRLTADRPIAACTDFEQRELNRDGSTKRIISPALTTGERNAIEARELAERTKRIANDDEARRNQIQLLRFPNPAAHNAARDSALHEARRAVKISEDRIATLAAERKPLLEDTEFFVGKPLPAKLKHLLDANDVAADAQRSLLQIQKEEIGRISANFDAELERLKRIWADAATLGGTAVAPASTAPSIGAGGSARRKTASN